MFRLFDFWQFEFVSDFDIRISNFLIKGVNGNMPCGRKRKKRKMAKHKRKKRLRRDRHKKR